MKAAFKNTHRFTSIQGNSRTFSFRRCPESLQKPRRMPRGTLPRGVTKQMYFLAISCHMGGSINGGKMDGLCGKKRIKINDLGVRKPPYVYRINIFLFLPVGMSACLSVYRILSYPILSSYLILLSIIYPHKTYSFCMADMFLSAFLRCRLCHVLYSCSG